MEGKSSTSERALIPAYERWTRLGGRAFEWMLGSSGFALGHVFLNADAVLVEAAGIEPAAALRNPRNLTCPPFLSNPINLPGSI